MQKPSTQDIILDELRTIQAEMKSANITLGKLSTTMDAVEEQTKRTNGRVNKLEIWRTAFVAGLMAFGMTLFYVWSIIDSFIHQLAQ